MNVALHPQPVNIISLCTGGAGLDLGIELAMPSARSVCLVEREAFAATNLVAAMQQGLLAEAPIWSDVTTFNGRPWRGLVDGVIGGIPCQPHSLAGKRLGEDDERDLWSDARRIIVQSGAWFVLIENVRGMVTSGGFERVWRDLRRLGFDVEPGLFTASEVGASHQRERLFVLAVADARCEQWRARRPDGRGARGSYVESAGSSAGRFDLADADHDALGRQYRPRSVPGTASPPQGEVCRHQREWLRARSGDGGADLANPHDSGLAVGQQPEIQRGYLRNEGKAAATGCSGVGNAIGSGHDRRSDDALGRSIKRTVIEGPSSGVIGAMADADIVELRREPSARQLAQLQPDDGPSEGYLFPPGPSDLSGWRSVLTSAPELEPAFRRVADGLASRLDTARVDRLRMLGNGVVSLEGAYAFRTLATRLAARGSAGSAKLVRLMEIA